MKRKRMSKRKRELLKELHDLQERTRIEIWFARSSMKFIQSANEKCKKIGLLLREEK